MSTRDRLALLQYSYRPLLRFGRSAALDTTITVMEQRGGPELLLGLDVIRKYSAVVDLGRNTLVLGGETIPFV